jgi:putative membrane protein
MLWIKALHILFVTSWFAGLFYLPRILVNLAMETDATSTGRLLLMARKLYRFSTMLMVPAVLLGGICGWVTASVKAPVMAGCMQNYCV